MALGRDNIDPSQAQGVVDPSQCSVSSALAGLCDLLLCSKQETAVSRSKSRPGKRSRVAPRVWADWVRGHPRKSEDVGATAPG